MEEKSDGTSPKTAEDSSERFANCVIRRHLFSHRIASPPAPVQYNL